VFYQLSIQDMLAMLPRDEQAELIFASELTRISSPGDIWPGDAADDTA
jgi:hypothetical protein